MRNGFKNLSSKLSNQELAALGDDAISKKVFAKPAGYRINNILQALFGLHINDLESNTLNGSEGTLYPAESDTYYTPYSIKDDNSAQPTVYIWKQEVAVHKVEKKEWYLLGLLPAPYPYSLWNFRGLSGAYNVLGKVGRPYHILSNQAAVLPMGS